MSAPTVQVLVGFQTTTGFATPFLLDDDPYGKLDTGTLGGYQLVDMTSQVLSVSITRGRNRELEQFNAGTASIRFKDPNRVLDPLNTASPYYPYVGPRQPVQVFAGGVQIYSGFVTDWDLSYDFVVAGDVNTASCADAFTVLAQQNMNEWTPTEQLSGARIDAVLNRPEVTYQGPYFLKVGSSTLGAFKVAAGTNVLTYLQNIAASEQGYLFIDRTGALAFLGRSYNLPVSDLTFSDTGSAVPYSALTNAFGDELLYNYIQAQSPAFAPGDPPATASDATSIALYQAQQYTKLDLLNSTTTEVNAMAYYLLGRYKNPVLRFTGLVVQLAALTADQQDLVLSADISEITSVTKSFSTGTPSSVTQKVFISGVSHEIVPGSHKVRFTFESTDSNGYFTLDSDIFGILDQDLLAF
jgi:hypothetical protein